MGGKIFSVVHTRSDFQPPLRVDTVAFPELKRPEGDVHYLSRPSSYTSVPPMAYYEMISAFAVRLIDLTCENN